MKCFSFCLCLALYLLPYDSKAECDGEAGRKQFNKCVACHSIEAGVQMAGPSLFGLYGRKAGKLEGFMFSLAMEEAGVVWTEQTLSEFLEHPMIYIQRSVMPFAGVRKT